MEEKVKKFQENHAAKTIQNKWLKYKHDQYEADDVRREFSFPQSPINCILVLFPLVLFHSLQSHILSFSVLWLVWSSCKKTIKISLFHLPLVEMIHVDVFNKQVEEGVDCSDTS